MAVSQRQMRLFTEKSIERTAWDRLNYPLFVPPDGSALVAILAKQGREQFIAELRRQAELGVTWAGAILGFLDLKGGINGKAHLERAEQRCLAAARAGDSYAQYVLAWVLVEQKRPEEAFRWMSRAATDGDFLPAWTDLGRFALNGVGVRNPDVARGIGLLWSAHRRGHKPPLVFICDIYRGGTCGLIRRMAAYVIAPYAIFRYYLSVRRKPFAQHVFVNFRPRKPFFSATSTA
jgi:TPR repeat protein